jgi:hypothetical protein
MEEILSSIRRIIADEETDDNRSGDDEFGAAGSQAEALDTAAEGLARTGEDEHDPDEDVLELTKVVRESGEVIDLQGERSSAEDVMGDGAQDEAEPVEVAAAHYPPEEEPVGAGRDHIQRKDQIVHSEHARAAELISATTASAASGAFARLSEVLQRTPEAESVADSSGRTVEQFIEDIARPVLKEWLDAHLPAIVERLVQKEIQKLSRRAELI